MLDPETQWINIPSQHEEMYQIMEGLLERLENHEISFDEWVDELHQALETYKSKRGLPHIGDVQ